MSVQVHSEMSVPEASPAGFAAPFGTFDVVALLGIFGALLLPLKGLWSYQGPPMEEGFMLAFPQRVLAGDLPHVDFLHLYGPGSLYVLAGVYRVFGSTLGAERSVGFVQHAMLVIAMFAVCRPWGRMIATAAALTALVIAVPPLGLSAMAWNGAIGLSMVALALVGVAIDRLLRLRAVEALDGLDAAVDANQRLRRARWLLGIAGMFWGAALLYRPDMVVSVGLAALTAWLVIGSVGFARTARRWLLGGVALVAALYVPFLVMVGPSAGFRGMFVEPVVKLRSGRSLPVPPSWSEPDGFLQRAGALRVSSWPLPMPAIGHQIAMWFWLVLASMVVVVVVAVWSMRREPTDVRSQVFAVAAALCVGLVGQALQRPDTAHLSWVSCVSFPLTMVAIAQAVRLRWAATSRPLRPMSFRWAAALAIGPILVVLVAVIPFYPLRTYADLVGQTFGRNQFGSPIVRGERRFYYGSADAARSAQRVVDELARRSKPGEPLIVGPVDLSRTPYSDAFFYYLFPELPPGTRYIEMDPGIADAAGSGLAGELHRSMWLIQSDVWSNWDEPNSSVDRGSPVPNGVVTDEYCTVVRTPQFRLLERCGAGLKPKR